jgi:hypothetical protein
MSHLSVGPVRNIRFPREHLRNFGVVFGAVMTAPSALLFISCFGPSEYQCILARIDADLAVDNPDVERLCCEFRSLQEKVVPPMTRSFETFLRDLNFSKTWDSRDISSVRAAIDEELFVVEPWRYYASSVPFSTRVAVSGASVAFFWLLVQRHTKWKSVNQTYRQLSHFGARLRYPLFVVNCLGFVSLLASYSEPA